MIPDDGTNPWITEQREAWGALAGATISRWSGVDSDTSWSDEPDELVFLDPGGPFQQLIGLRAECADGLVLDLSAFYNSGDIGELAIERSDGRAFPTRFGLRESDLTNLPVGKVESIEFHLAEYGHDWRALVEVLLTIGGRPLLVVAAEIMPDHRGPIYRWSDEDLFVFVDPAEADRVDWYGGARVYSVAGLADWPRRDTDRWGG